jgi:hypothetical protein
VTRSIRLPIVLLTLVCLTLLAGFIDWANTRHFTCEDSDGGSIRSMVLFARWGGLATAVVSRPTRSRWCAYSRRLQ